MTSKARVETKYSLKPTMVSYYLHVFKDCAEPRALHVAKVHVHMGQSYFFFWLAVTDVRREHFKQAGASNSCKGPENIAENTISSCSTHTLSIAG